MPQDSRADAPPVVQNAANPKQVDAAGKKVRNVARQQLDDMRAILDLPEGRRFLWRLLGHCRVNQSVFETSSRIAYNSGMQDVGHFVLSEIVKARPDAWVQMMVEHSEETNNGG